MQQTHDLSFARSTVTKTYTSWGRGEPDREWAALTVLAEHAPGLAPEPLERHEVDGRPAITMTRLPGTPLGTGPLTVAQTDAVAHAVRRVHAVPLHALPPVLGERISGPSRFAADIGAWLAPDVDLTPCRDPHLVAEAVDAARAWIATPPAGARLEVLALADGNLANFLWDGERCRVVDLEDSGASDRAYELADQVEHITFRVAGQGDPDRLATAAGLPDDDRPRWASYRGIFACFWLVMLLPGNPAWSRNPESSTEDQSRHLLRILGVT